MAENPGFPTADELDSVRTHVECVLSGIGEFLESVHWKHDGLKRNFQECDSFWFDEQIAHLQINLNNLIAQSASSINPAHIEAVEIAVADTLPTITIDGEPYHSAISAILHMTNNWDPPKTSNDPDWLEISEESRKYLSQKFMDSLEPFSDERLLELKGRLRRELLIVKGRISSVEQQPPEVETPEWDSDTGKLWFRGKMVRKVSGQAKNVRKVLAAFQESDWPNKIDDPLSGGSHPERLKNTLASLNHNLPMIRFRGDGTGEAFLWELSS